MRIYRFLLVSYVLYFYGTFFAEKSVEYRTYHYDIGNTFYSIDSETVINYILNIDDGILLKKIENTIKIIDFQSRDIHNFLKFTEKYIALNNNPF